MGRTTGILAILITALVAASCGSGSGSGNDQPDPPAASTLSAAMQQFERLPTPPGLSDEEFDALRDEAIGILSERDINEGGLKQPDALARDSLQLMHDGSAFRWLFRHTADMDGNGLVDAADFAAVAGLIGTEGPFEAGSAEFRADGNADGEIDMADVQLVALRFGSRISELRLYCSADASDYPARNQANGPGSVLLGKLTPSQALTDSSGYMLFATSPQDGSYYWLRSVRDGAEVGVSTMYGGSWGQHATSDPGNSNNLPYMAPAEPALYWVQSGDEVLGEQLAAGPGQRIYDPGSKGLLRAISSDGILLWEYDCGSEITAAPAVLSDGGIIVGNADGELLRLSADAELLWNVSLNGRLAAPVQENADGSLIACSRQGTVYALRSNGSQLWSRNQAERIYGRPALDSAGNILVVTENGKLAMLDSNGDRLWELSLDGTFYNGPTLTADGSSYLSSSDDLYRIDSEGKLSWSYDLGRGRGRIVLGADNQVFCIDGDDNLLTLSPDGELLSRLPLSTEFNLTCRTADGSLLLIQHRKLLAIDSSGELLWEFALPQIVAQLSNNDGFLDFPVLSADGLIYCRTNYGSLMSIGNSSGETLPVAKLRTKSEDTTSGWLYDLNASYSRVTAGEILRYDWDLDGDGRFELKDGPAQMELNFPAQAETERIPVSVRIWDSNGNLDTDTVLVYVR